jgi:tetratricopeptide (TPR) repeat protein
MTASKNSTASMRANVATGCLIVLLLSAPSAAENRASPTAAPVNQGESPTAKPEADSVKKATDAFAFHDRLKALIQQGRYREATDQWEQDSSVDHRVFKKWLAWELAQAYVKQERYEIAIDMYKSQYHFITESIDQRAELGEVLLFGEVGWRPTKENNFAVGKGQCHLCHRIFKESVKEDLADDPYQPYLFNFAHRIKGLIASPKYQHRPENTEQPEAFPGSGKAATLIEYLAESNVCPSCYVAPRIGRTDNDRESLVPKIHKPPISLTIDEMVAIDTWLLKQEREEIPSVAVMRAAYEKFLRPEDRVPPIAGIRLAALYDAKGDLAEAIRLLDATYQAMLPARGSWELAELGKLRDDPHAFRNLKQRSDTVAKFPKLLQVDRP